MLLEDARKMTQVSRPQLVANLCRPYGILMRRTRFEWALK